VIGTQMSDRPPRWSGCIPNSTGDILGSLKVTTAARNWTAQHLAL
jgi:hypothetical protein